MSEAMQVYPAGLCKAIVDAVKLQKQWDAAGQYVLGNVELGTKGNSTRLASTISVVMNYLRKKRSSGTMKFNRHGTM